MKTSAGKQKPIPVYFGLRIYLTAILIYTLLVFPISLIMLFKYGPYWMEEREARKTSISETIGLLQKPGPIDHPFDAIDTPSNVQQSNEISFEPGDEHFPKSISFIFRALLISIIVSIVWNYPFKRLFRLKRKRKRIPDKLLLFSRKWLLKSPFMNTLIAGAGFGVPALYMAYQLFGNQFESSSGRQFYEQFFFISVFASFLSVLFLYFWFRHRIRFVYLDHVFDSLSLYAPGENRYRDKINRKLWINSGMTTLLPLVIVVFYLSFSKSPIREAGAPELSRDQVEILFGKYVSFIDQSTLFQSESLFYVNAIDSLLMFVGIFSGILISILYLFFFVNWTQHSIVIPINEVLEKMRQSGDDELGRLAVLRTNDELGELANGYNEMALRISNNISSLRNLTEASMRFVPKEFLQMLNKPDISDIRLGDQVQRTMSVLFVDIRSFTSISEQLSPKDNFDFLNEYLGFMEPLIRKHNGFIDKFIGDSIMALFGHSADDAVNAALEMHEQLQIFNHRMRGAGKPAIDTGAGIHTGNLMLGVVGGAGRMETTVISDSVNLASRLEGLTRSYNAYLIISESTKNLISQPQNYHFDYLDEVHVKGRMASVKVFAVSKPTQPILPTSANYELIDFESVKNYVVAYLLNEHKNKKLPYHNSEHTLDVLNAAQTIGKAMKLGQYELLLLQTAALTHETGIYKNYHQHEHQSVAFIHEHLPQFGYTTEDISIISQLVLSTQMPQQPNGHLEEILCDADLDYLGRNDYTTIAERLRQEWIFLGESEANDEQWLLTQEKFLKAHNYFTIWSKNNRNAGKWQNLALIRDMLNSIQRQKNQHDTDDLDS